MSAPSVPSLTRALLRACWLTDLFRPGCQRLHRDLAVVAPLLHECEELRAIEGQGPGVGRLPEHRHQRRSNPPNALQIKPAAQKFAASPGPVC